MKRSKKLIALFLVLAVLCGGTVLLSQMEETKEQIQNTGEIILSILPENVSTLRWETEDNALSFHKEDTWLYDGDAAFPVDGEKLLKMLSIFESFGVSFVIEDVTDFGMYGLDEPVCTIEFTAGDETYTVTLGDYSTMDGERYLSIGDGKVYLAKTDPLDTFDIALRDMIHHDAALPGGEVEVLRFEGMESYTITRETDSDHAYFADDLYYAQREGNSIPLDTDRVESYLDLLTSLELSDFVTYNVTEEQLTAYGLDTPELTITAEYTDEQGVAGVYTLSVSRDAEELSAAEEAEANGKDAEDVTAYVRVGQSQIIYRITAYQGESLQNVSFHALCHREVLPADFEAVTRMDVTLEGTEYTLAAEEQDGETVWTYAGETFEINPLQKALDGLTVEYVTDFTSEFPGEKAEISLTVSLSDENRPTVQIDLYRRDGTYCLAVVDGEPLALISRSDVVDLVEAVNAIVLA